MNSRSPECLVLGEPAAGKTLFTLALAEALGQTRLELSQTGPAGRVVTRGWTTGEAKAALVGHGSGNKAALQWTTLEVRLGFGRGRTAVVMVDSAGLPPVLPPDPETRASAAETLRMLRRAHIILHVVDASRPGVPGELDRELAAYGRGHRAGRYALIANKIDLPSGRAGLRRLRRALPGVEILPISALHGTGLPAVTRCLRRFLLARPPPRAAGGAGRG